MFCVLALRQTRHSHTRTQYYWHKFTTGVEGPARQAFRLGGLSPKVHGEQMLGLAVLGSVIM